ncbi:sodium channel protein Nach [Aphomia sociella]
MKITRTSKETKTFNTKRDNYAKKLKRKKLISYLETELGTSTTHGLPYIVNTDSHWLETLFWVASFLCSLGLVYFLLSTQYIRYINAPIVMSVEKDYFNWNISYPAITLCPANKIDEDDLNTLVNETLESIGINMSMHYWTIASISLETIENLSPEIKATSEKILYPNDYMEIAIALFKRVNNDTITTNTNTPISVESAMTEMGMCNVINSNVAIFDDPDKRRSDILKYTKKNIELSIYDRDFFTQLYHYNDTYKVYIHSPDETILCNTPSYPLKDHGYKTFGMKVWSIRASDQLRYLPLADRKCRFFDEPISKRYPIYSYNHCMLECRIQMILKLCNCVPHFYKYMSYERVCELHELRCIIPYKTEIVKLTTSKVTWYKFENKKGLPRSPRDCGCLNNCETDLYLKEHEEYVIQSDSRLRIGISSFPKVRVVREIIFSVYDIILRSGGVINLCLGTSIISLMELLVIAIKLTAMLTEKFRLSRVIEIAFKLL